VLNIWGEKRAIRLWRMQMSIVQSMHQIMTHSLHITLYVTKLSIYNKTKSGESVILQRNSQTHDFKHAIGMCTKSLEQSTQIHINRQFH